MSRRRKPLGMKARPLDPDDPRNLSHPIHREKWLELARAMGRMDARKDFEAIHGALPKEPTIDRQLKARRPKTADSDD